MVRSIENFLSEEERNLIMRYVKEIAQRHTVYDERKKGMPDLPDNKPLKRLIKDKRVEWKSALMAGWAGSTRTYYKAIMDGDWDCPIKSFLDTSDELLLAENDVSFYQEEVLKKLAEGLQICKDGKMKCPCPADA